MPHDREAWLQKHPELDSLSDKDFVTLERYGLTPDSSKDDYISVIIKQVAEIFGNLESESCESSS